MNEKMIKQVPDLGMAAYLMMHAHNVLGKKNKSVLFEILKDESKRFEESKLDYLISDYHRFDACLMSLKKMGEYENIQGRPVTDLGMAAYLMMHGYKVLGKKSKSVLFEIPKDDLKTLEQKKMDYLTSEFHRFDACLMSLKKMEEL